MFVTSGRQIVLASLALVLIQGVHRVRPDEQPQTRAKENEQGGQTFAPLVSYLLPNETHSDLVDAAEAQEWARRVLRLLQLVGPDMKPASGFKDPPNITLDDALQAWRLMHKHASRVAFGRVSTSWPIVEQALIEAAVSRSCLSACGAVAKGALGLETWALKLLNAWGQFPPAGLFEGTLGDIGSFHGCLGVPENEVIGHAHYCSFSFRPVLATRRDYELIISQEPPELLNLFGAGDVFSELARKTQYNHYVYFKLGTCLPIGCSPFDAQKIALLLASRAMLMPGPVKCHSKFERDYQLSEGGRTLKLSSRDLNSGIYIWRPHVSQAQWVALVCISLLLALVFAATATDLILNRNFGTSPGSTQTGQPIEAELKLGTLTVMDHVVDAPEDLHQGDLIAACRTGKRAALDSKCVNGRTEPAEARPRSVFLQLAHDFSLVTNTIEFFATSPQQLKRDILCMNGLRCITMSWIILAHTVQYNDWSAFGRIYEVEAHLKSLLSQPIFNASYLVDTFFLMSGLLTSYSTFRHKTKAHNFSVRAYLLGRYLRLTPQVLLVALLFILLPLAGSPTSGPHWQSMTGEYAENCAQNWWVNLLHAQAFYKPDEMCNFVCWWISVDMLYHLLGLAFILAILKLGVRALAGLCACMALTNACLQAARHLEMGLPPNLLATIPQTGAMWSQMTLNYFWTPHAHLFPFLFGFQLGHWMTQRPSDLAAWFSLSRSRAGWLVASLLFGLVSFGTHFWVVGDWKRAGAASTVFALGAQIIWSLCIAWTIVACQLGHGASLNRLLSCKLFIVLGRASYLVYLSHFLIIFAFFGSQNLLLEPSRAMLVYIILGNVCLSMAFGSFLCVAFEMPWLKIQRRIMRLV